MKPVAIFRHAPEEGPGYFAIFLDAHSGPWTLVAIDDGEPAPTLAGVSDRRLAAVDDQARTGDEPGFVRSQVGDRAGDFLGLRMIDQR